VLSNKIGCPCHVGLYFEAYAPGKAFNWRSLKSLKNPGAVSTGGKPWNGWVPLVQHEELKQRVWFPRDSDFVRDIPGFNKVDGYVLRWSGQITVPLKGGYTFQTNSDDGSLIYIDGKLIVDNDGDHGPRSKGGSATLIPGAHAMVITFYEHGGGSKLEVSWTPTPGAKLVPLSHEVLSNKMGCGHYSKHVKAQEPCDGNSLLFEAYVRPKNFNWNSLKSVEATVFENSWNGWTPAVQHREIMADIYYANDAKFVQDIPKFASTDRYVMRWRGQILVPVAGTYTFWTRSDDGSMLYIDRKRVVDNDGNHGPKSAQGSTKLAKKGKHDITITFYESERLRSPSVLYLCVYLCISRHRSDAALMLL
jgi:hypothetical protein